MRAQRDAGDDAEPAAAALQRPEEIGIRAGVGDFDVAVGGHDFRLQQARPGLSEGLRATAEAAAQNEADDADRHAAAALHVAAGLGHHLVVHMSPDCAGLDRDGLLRLSACRAAGADERIVQRHGVHVTRPDEKRVGGVGCSQIAVAAALHHEPQIVFPCEIDRGDDILRRLGGDRVDAWLRRPRPDPAERLGEPDLVAEVVGILEFLEHLLASRVGRSADAIGERRAHLDEASPDVVIELIPARFRRPCRIAETDARLRRSRSRGAARETAHERKRRGDLRAGASGSIVSPFPAPWPPAVGSLAVCPERFQGAPARSISATSASGNSISAAAARRPGI